MADTAVYMLQATAFQLLATKPWSSVDLAEMTAELPPPMCVAGAALLPPACSTCCAQH
jgi:hypothetical protein